MLVTKLRTQISTFVPSKEILSVMSALGFFAVVVRLEAKNALAVNITPHYLKRFLGSGYSTTHLAHTEKVNQLIILRV